MFSSKRTTVPNDTKEAIRVQYFVWIAGFRCVGKIPLEIFFRGSRQMGRGDFVERCLLPEVSFLGVRQTDQRDIGCFQSYIHW